MYESGYTGENKEWDGNEDYPISEQQSTFLKWNANSRTFRLILKKNDTFDICHWSLMSDDNYCRLIINPLIKSLKGRKKKMSKYHSYLGHFQI